MRTKDEIQKEWDSTLSDIQNFEMIECAPRCLEFKNEQWRRSLKEEYSSLLPLDKQLALYIGTLKRDKNFLLERAYAHDTLDDDWTEFSHNRYLITAREIIKTFNLSNLDKCKVLLSMYEHC